MSSNKIVFLVWDRQSIRAYGISKHIGASLHYLFTTRIKHPVLYVRTLQLLRKKRPHTIICQSPPITCAFVAMVYKFLFAKGSKPRILIDVHTGAISRPWSRNFSRIIMKRASANIVINNEQQNYLIENYRVKPIVLEDPIPDFSDILSSTKKNEGYRLEQKAISHVAVIASFAFDEPMREIFEAASKLPDIYFYVTGDKKNADQRLISGKSENVIITGFLDYNTYVDLLQKVDVIMDLTTDNTSIVAGAFEAVALEKPLITSNWVPMRRYFNRGTVYVKNSTEDIKNAIVAAVRRKEELSEAMHQLKIERTKDWTQKISNFSYLFQ